MGNIQDASIIDGIKKQIQNTLDKGGIATIKVSNVQSVDITGENGWNESLLTGRMSITIELFPEDQCVGVVR